MSLEKKIAAEISEQLRAVNKSLPKAFGLIDEALKKELGPQGYERYKAFNTKYQVLKSQGKDQEAEELRKKWLESEQN